MMASMPEGGEVWNAPRIYKAALLCIFLSTSRGYESDTLL